MMVEITASLVLQVVQTIALIVGIVYYIMTLRNTRRNQELQIETRQLQLYTTVFQPSQTKEWLYGLIDVLYMQEWEDYDDFWSKYGPESNPEAYVGLIQALEMFTMIGLYVEQKALDIEIVVKHHGRFAMRLWEIVEPFVRAHRDRTGNSMHWHSFEYLYGEMKKYLAQQKELRT